MNATGVVTGEVEPIMAAIDPGVQNAPTAALVAADCLSSIPREDPLETLVSFQLGHC